MQAWGKQQYEWAGKLVRQGLQEPDRIPLNVLCWKSISSLHQFAGANGGWQGHPKRFRPWRWETEIYNFFYKRGLAWISVASDAVDWKQHLEITSFGVTVLSLVVLLGPHEN